MNGHGFLRNPGKRRGRGGGPSFGRFRFPRFTIGLGRFGNITLRYLWPSLIFRPGGGGGGARRPPHPLHFRGPVLNPVLEKIVTKPPQTVALGIPGAVGTIIAITGYAIYDRAIRLMREQREREIEAGLEKERRRAHRYDDFRVLTVPPPPELLPFYDYPIAEPLIGRPVPTRAPAIPADSPARFPEIAPPRPAFAEPPRPIFSPPQVAPPTIRPVPAAPVRFPVEFPTYPVGQPTPFLPFNLPFAQPFNVPTLPGPVSSPGIPGTVLTPFNPVGVPSRFAAPDTSPKGGTKKGSCECPDTRTKQRKRRQDCAKGFYRERAGKITYTPWAKIDCITGREI